MSKINKINRAVKQFERSDAPIKLFKKALFDGTNIVEIVGYPYTCRHKELVAGKAERIKDAYPAPFCLVDMGHIVYLIHDKLEPLSEDLLFDLDVSLGHISGYRNGKLFIIEIDYFVPCAVEVIMKHRESLCQQ